MNIRSIIARLTILTLIGNLVVLSIVRVEVRADVKKRVQIHIGKPSIWSLSQAHYLLASMHKKNLALDTSMPTKDDLDPNRSNGTRVQTLKTLLDIEAQYSQKVGVENQAALREQQFSLRRREQAQAELAARENELDVLDGRINRLKKELAPLQEEENQRDLERMGKDGKIDTADDEPMTDADRKRRKDLALLKEKIAQRTDERTALVAEIGKLEKTATDPVTAPKLSEADFSNPNPAITLPGLDNIKSLIDKAVAGSGKPTVAATIALDNYVQMQYDIIAKQLTLLRDELGPDERIVFLELPASIYTVPGKADDYLAQVQWRVNRYFDIEQSPYWPNQQAVGPQSGRSDTVAITVNNASSGEAAVTAQRSSVQSPNPNPNGQNATLESRAGEKSDESQQPTDKTKSTLQSYINNYEHLTADKMLKALPSTPGLDPSNKQAQLAQGGGWRSVTMQPDQYQIRAVDIIPHQSALNINDYHATASRVNFLGVLKLLSGLGIKVNYQRQRELYEEFLQQEIFAAGFGKGSNAFGWTYGPLPGSKRVEPGVRTTYAVLVVPKTATMLELEASAVAFDRRKAPDYDLKNKVYEEPTNQKVSSSWFYISVPSLYTENFQIESVEYTTVTKGQFVTAIVKGNSLSPQAGILVNGVPLQRALSATNTGSSTASAIEDGVKGVHGVYEQVSSQEIVLNFSMGDSNYAGTPTITLVTPQRSSAINFFDIWVNYHREHQRSLDVMSATEPMFIDEFKLTGFDIIEKDIDNGHVLARLSGSGLRRRATILINDQELDFRTPVVELRPVPTTFPNGSPGNTIWEYVEMPSRRAIDCFRLNGRIAPPPVPAYCPCNRENFAFQESTGSYLLYFKRPKADKWVIRYRHRTKQGIESQDTAYEVPTKSPFKVMHYLPDPQRRLAVVDVRYQSEDKVTTPAFKIDGTPCTTCPVSVEGNGKFRTTFSLPYENVGGTYIERDTVSITAVQGTKPDGTPNAETDDVSLPVTPRVSRVINPRLGRPVGYAGEQPLVHLIGFNLQQVAKVFFGDNEGKISGAPSPTSILVKVPKLDGVPKGEAIQVPVTLEKLDGKKVSSVAFYTYVGSPVPVVLYNTRKPAGRREAALEDTSDPADTEVNAGTESQANPRPSRTPRRRR